MFWENCWKNSYLLQCGFRGRGYSFDINFWKSKSFSVRLLLFLYFFSLLIFVHGELITLECICISMKYMKPWILWMSSILDVISASLVHSKPFIFAKCWPPHNIISYTIFPFRSTFSNNPEYGGKIHLC